ncbi:MAG: RMD1 family protein [Gammaproteobacteria bacterium]|nr:RMD1 family protein [Gammaproteobacteria bacterium]MDH3507626.1 RMD1 family protein [Gammaproteobacteria bacterium]
MERRGGGYVALFRFGVVVVVNLDDAEESALLDSVMPIVSGKFAERENEAYDILIDREAAEHIDARGVITLRELSIERFLVVAHALAKSVMLAHHETSVMPIMTRVETIALDLQAGRTPARPAQLVSKIGNVLLMESRTVSRIEITEKPAITWDDPALDRLYERIASDLELRERDVALTRKLALIARTSELYLDLLSTRQGLRLEWYIVVLIAVEIVLIVYDIFASS